MVGLFKKQPVWLAVAIGVIITTAGTFIFSAPNVFASAVLGVSSAVIQNTTSTTVDFAVTGSDFDRFYDSGNQTADSTDLSHIHYHSATPISATITGDGAFTATFPISVGSYNSGGAFTIGAGTLANSGQHNLTALSIPSPSITDNAKPVVVFVSSDGDAFDGNTSSPQQIEVSFSEPIPSTPTISVSPDGGNQTVTDCGDSNPANVCFDYTLPSDTSNTETVNNSGAQDSLGNVMDSDGNHFFTVTPEVNALDITAQLENNSLTTVEMVIPAAPGETRE